MEIELCSLPPIWPVWTQQFFYIKINYRFTSLVKSKPVKLEVSYSTVLLLLTKLAIIYNNVTKVMLAYLEQALSKFIWLLKMGHPRPLFRLFSSFQTNITILTTNICEKCYDHPVCGTGIRTHDLQNTSIPPQFIWLFVSSLQISKLEV